jgi:hypothetical protein
MLINKWSGFFVRIDVSVDCVVVRLIQRGGGWNLMNRETSRARKGIQVAQFTKETQGSASVVGSMM